MAEHRHYSIDVPPLFCEECGKRWSLVLDGREGRRRRRSSPPPAHRRANVAALDVDRLARFLGPHPQDPELRRQRAVPLAAVRPEEPPE